MSEIHSCSYYCIRPACVLRRRDELRDKLEQAEPDAVLEALKLARSIIGHPDDAHSKLIDAVINKHAQAAQDRAK
jgi:hypothetical protein